MRFYTRNASFDGTGGVLLWFAYEAVRWLVAVIIFIAGVCLCLWAWAVRGDARSGGSRRRVAVLSLIPLACVASAIW